MNTIEVQKLEFSTEYPGLDEISERLDDLDEKFPVGVTNWKDYDYKPRVSFSIACTSNEILLKFYTDEKWLRAVNTETNQEVYEDSCVEFFVSPSDDGIYYNFEFNPLGTCLMGFGHRREGRKRADPSIVSRIRRCSSVYPDRGGSAEGNFFWTLTIALPFTVFCEHEIIYLTGKSIRANFYKCGDRLPVPHYLSWNPIQTPKPDFHRPEYFGILRFL